MYDDIVGPTNKTVCEMADETKGGIADTLSRILECFDTVFNTTASSIGEIRGVIATEKNDLEEAKTKVNNIIKEIERLNNC